MTDGRNPSSDGSRLADTGAKLPAVVSQGLLGNAHQRKDRGRWADLPVTGQQFTVLSVTGDDQLSAGCQVQCSLQQLQQPAADEFLSDVMPAVLGTVRWGTDGVQHQAEFDWLHGVTFSLSASFLEVSARVLLESQTAQPIPVRAGAALGYFPHSKPLRRSFFAREIESLGEARFPVPAFARNVSILLSPHGSVIAVQEDRSGFPLVMRNTLEPITMQLAPDVARVVVANTSGAGLNQVTAAYELWI